MIELKLMYSFLLYKPLNNSFNLQGQLLNLILSLHIHVYIYVCMKNNF